MESRNNNSSTINRIQRERKMVHQIWFLLLVCPAMINCIERFLTIEQDQTARITCEADEQISITGATWSMDRTNIDNHRRNETRNFVMPLNWVGKTCSYDGRGSLQQWCDGRNQCIFNATDVFLDTDGFVDCSYTKKLELAYVCVSGELNQRSRRRRHSRDISASLHIRSALNASDVVLSPQSHNIARRGAYRKPLKVSTKYLRLSKKYSGPTRIEKLKERTKYNGGCPHPAFEIKHVIIDINPDTVTYAEWTADERHPLRAKIHSVNARIQSLFYAPDMEYDRDDNNKCYFRREANKYNCVIAHRNDANWTCTAMGREYAAHSVYTGHYLPPRH